MTALGSVGPTVTPVGGSVRSGSMGPTVTPVESTVSALGSVGQIKTPVGSMVCSGKHGPDSDSSEGYGVHSGERGPDK